MISLMVMMLKKLKRLFFLKFHLSWMERGLLVKNKFVAKTSTTGVSKKSRAIVDSVVAIGPATVEDILMGDADSEPFQFIQSCVKVPTPLSLYVNILILRADRKFLSSTTPFLSSSSSSFVRCASLLYYALLLAHGKSTACLYCVKQLTW